MRVLIAYGSERGGTQGLAEWLGSSLEELGYDVTVSRARDIDGVADYDSVIVGGALYTFRWHRDARRFVKRHEDALREMPVWLFSSGPLDDSAAEKTVPPVRFVRRALERIRARGHMTFGGRLQPGASNTKLPTGDWRDKDGVDKWAREIANVLTGV
ncbi:MAG: flavodoxin domain-containing protein [Acidimicrobiia bacterium]|jgi:menaquinone-dependent protoporphyrinogen oxidase